MAQGVTVDFNANTAKFTEGVDRSIHSLNKFKSEAAAAGKVLGAAFAAATAAAAYLVKQSIDSADAMSKMSQSTGIAIDKLSGLAYAGQLSGVEVEALGAAMVKLTKGMADASIGTGEALRGYEALGINVKDAAGNLKNAEAVLGEVATKFASMEDGANKTALAVAIFGKSGAAMIPLLNSGADGLAQMHDEAEKLGLILDKKTGQAAVDFKDNLTRLQSKANGLGIILAKDLLPQLNDITAAMVEAAKESGGLMAAWVGLGGVATALFTDDMLSRAEQIQKRVKSLGAEIESAEGMAGRITPISAPLRAERQKLRLELEGIQHGIEEAERRAKERGVEKKPEAPMMKSLEEINKAGKAAKQPATKDYDQHINEFLRMQKEAQQEMQRSALEAQAIIADIDPIYKAGLAWERLTELVEQGLLTQEQAGRAYAETFKGAADQMTVFAEQAGRNIQDAFSEFLFDPFKGGLDGMLNGFQEMLRRMAAEALASNILDAVGNWGKTGGGAGTFIGDIAGAVFGGARAIGGPVAGGTSYLVGERGPEIFTPSSSGNITPNDKIGKSITINLNQTFHVPAPTDRRTQEQIAVMAGASIQTAMMRGA